MTKYSIQYQLDAIGGYRKTVMVEIGRVPPLIVVEFLNIGTQKKTPRIIVKPMRSSLGIKKKKKKIHRIVTAAVYRKHKNASGSAVKASLNKEHHIIEKTIV